MELGVKQKPLEVPAAPGKGKKEAPKTNYPSTRFEDEVADKLRAEHALTVGEKGTAIFHFNVVGDTQDKYSNQLHVELTDIHGVKVAGKKKTDADGDNDGDADEKILGFKPKKVSRPAPDTSEADIED